MQLQMEDGGVNMDTLFKTNLEILSSFKMVIAIPRRMALLRIGFLRLPMRSITTA